MNRVNAINETIAILKQQTLAFEILCVVGVARQLEFVGTSSDQKPLQFLDHSLPSAPL